MSRSWYAQLARTASTPIELSQGQYLHHLSNPPDPPLVATINGPSVVAHAWAYTFSVNVTGGTGSYTYTWSSPAESSEATTFGGFCEDGVAQVTVSDGPNTVTATMPVTVSYELAPPPLGQFVPCMQMSHGSSQVQPTFHATRTIKAKRDINQTAVAIDRTTRRRAVYRILRRGSC